MLRVGAPQKSGQVKDFLAGQDDRDNSDRPMAAGRAKDASTLTTSHPTLAAHLIARRRFGDNLHPEHEPENLLPSWSRAVHFFTTKLITLFLNKGSIHNLFPSPPMFKAISVKVNFYIALQ